MFALNLRRSPCRSLTQQNIFLRKFLRRFQFLFAQVLRRSQTCAGPWGAGSSFCSRNFLPRYRWNRLDKEIPKMPGGTCDMQYDMSCIWWGKGREMSFTG